MASSGESNAAGQTLASQGPAAAFACEREPLQKTASLTEEIIQLQEQVRAMRVMLPWG